MMNRDSAQASVSRYLSADHARLDLLFETARACVGSDDFARASAAFRELADGLARHIAVEERVLFPVFDARVGMQGPTTVMQHEHRRIEQLLARAAAALAVNDGGAFAREAGELAAILRAHNMKEEHILYPRTDASLGDAERAEIVAALQLG